MIASRGPSPTIRASTASGNWALTCSSRRMNSSIVLSQSGCAWTRTPSCLYSAAHWLPSLARICPAPACLLRPAPRWPWSCRLAGQTRQICTYDHGTGRGRPVRRTIPPRRGGADGVDRVCLRRGRSPARVRKAALVRRPGNRRAGTQGQDGVMFLGLAVFAESPCGAGGEGSGVPRQ